MAPLPLSFRFLFPGNSKTPPLIALACKLHEGFGNQGVMGEAVGLIGRRMSLERIRTMRSIGPEGVAGRTPDIKSIAVAMV
jgi:hypothetical protein